MGRRCDLLGGTQERRLHLKRDNKMMLRFRGFTLIELLIAVAIFVFLIMLAGPQLAQFLASSQVRNAAEAVYTGVQKMLCEKVAAIWTYNPEYVEVATKRLKNYQPHPTAYVFGLEQATLEG